jgi:Protein of unknown function (DUF1579)
MTSWTTRCEEDGGRRHFFGRQPTFPRAVAFGIDMLHRLPRRVRHTQFPKGESMKTSATSAVATVILAGAVWAADPPKMPAPQKEHEWLKQLVGEWVTESEAVMGPGQPPVKCQGTEVVRSLGDFFTVGEMKTDFMGTPVTGVMTLGYDPTAKKYVGTWVCSMGDHLWKYEGTVDASGKVLTLNTEGPDMTTPGKMAKMKDVIEIKDKDHRVLTSHIQTADGKWVQFMTMHARRK